MTSYEALVVQSMWGAGQNCIEYDFMENAWPKPQEKLYRVFW